MKRSSHFFFFFGSFEMKKRYNKSSDEQHNHRIATTNTEFVLFKSMLENNIKHFFGEFFGINFIYMFFNKQDKTFFSKENFFYCHFVR
jgi:hypothetical protein